MKIIIGNDHGGYAMKKILVSHLEKLGGYEVIDSGCHSTDIVRYPYYAAKVARAVQKGEADRGILICSTGIGMSIVANKYKGIRAALVNSSYQARMTSAHNNSNILCLGGKCIGPFEAVDYLESWLKSEYEGGRHDISLGLIAELEDTNLSDKEWDPGIPDKQKN